MSKIKIITFSVLTLVFFAVFFGDFSFNSKKIEKEFKDIDYSNLKVEPVETKSFEESSQTTSEILDEIKKDLDKIKKDLDEILIMVKERVNDKKSKEGNKE